MATFEDGKNVLLKRPEPGRPDHPVVAKEEPKEMSKDDVSKIANAVIDAIANKMPTITVHGEQGQYVGKKDDFDPSASLGRMAESMIIQRGDSESNFDDLGKIKETKKDDKTVDSTIDILSNIGDEDD